MNDLVLKNPAWLLLWLALPVIWWWRGRQRITVLLVPFSAHWFQPSLTPRSRWPVILTSLGLTCLIVALARPQRVEDKQDIRNEGYDLILAIDLSGSMETEDFERNGERLNRLQVIKPVIQAFIEGRPNDRIGMVVFAGRAYTLAPLTLDHEWLARQVERLSLGMIEDGTAIGDGLGVSLSRLDQSDLQEGGRRLGAFVILLTDGANTRGSLTPEQAARIAKSRGVPVYSIGAGRDGLVPFPVRDANGRRIGTQRILSDLDERALRMIADQTGGKYFRADDVRTIENAFRSIDQAQKIQFQAQSYLVTTELFTWVAVPGVTLFLLGIAAAAVRRPESVDSNLGVPRAQDVKA